MKYLIFFSLAILIYSETTQCPQTGTINTQMCIQSYIPVCGYSADGQELGTFQNSCYACKDINVAYYDSDACVYFETSASSETTNPNGTVTSSNSNATNSSGSSNSTVTKCSTPKSENTICPQIYTPTCGLFNQSIQCIKAPCGQQFSNECEACSNANVESYYFGDCNSTPEAYVDPTPAADNNTSNNDYVQCTDPRPEVCTEIYTDTCAFTEFPCYSDTCQKSAGNQCDACSNNTIVGYILEKCSDYAQIYQSNVAQTVIDVTKYQCSSTRPTNCDQTEQQVCAQLTCTDNSCEQEFTNDCLACSNSAVKSYYKGQCQTSIGSIITVVTLMMLNF